MLYKATISFAGKISMTQGEIRDISDSPVVKDLIKAGYIEKVEKTGKKKTAKKEDKA
jgi:hypothetical protein